jgi:hypothetical protein
MSKLDLTKKFTLRGAKTPAPKTQAPAPAPAPKAQTPVREVNFKCQKKESKLHLKYYVSDAERRELIQTLGEPACLLFEHYLRKAGLGKGDDVLTDNDAAFHFSWDPQKAKRNRLKLTKAGWFRQMSYKSLNGRKAVTYYVGKEAVIDSHKK